MYNNPKVKKENRGYTIIRKKINWEKVIEKYGDEISVKLFNKLEKMNYIGMTEKEVVKFLKKIDL